MRIDGSSKIFAYCSSESAITFTTLKMCGPRKMLVQIRSTIRASRRIVVKSIGWIGRASFFNTSSLLERDSSGPNCSLSMNAWRSISIRTTSPGVRGVSVSMILTVMSQRERRVADSKLQTVVRVSTTFLRVVKYGNTTYVDAGCSNSWLSAEKQTKFQPLQAWQEPEWTGTLRGSSAHFSASVGNCGFALGS